MKAINARESLTEREREEFTQEKEIAKLTADYQLLYKDKELEIKRIEVKWTQIFRLPLAIIMLPVRVVMAFAIITSLITKKELPKEFWDFLKG